MQIFHNNVVCTDEALLYVHLNADFEKRFGKRFSPLFLSGAPEWPSAQYHLGTAKSLQKCYYFGKMIVYRKCEVRAHKINKTLAANDL